MERRGKSTRSVADEVASPLSVRSARGEPEMRVSRSVDVYPRCPGRSGPGHEGQISTGRSGTPIDRPPQTFDRLRGTAVARSKRSPRLTFIGPGDRSVDFQREVLLRRDINNIETSAIIRYAHKRPKTDEWSLISGYEIDVGDNSLGSGVLCK